MTTSPARGGARVSRRRFLAGGLATATAVAVGGYELVDHGVLPGRHALEVLEGDCSVAAPHETFVTAGPTVTGRFHSRARGREVGYAIAYPPGRRPGDAMPLGLLLHADGGSHASPLGGVPAARALAGDGIAPFALVSFDGGDLYWNPHPGDDPMAMIVDEIVPMCRARGLGRRAGTIAAVGISMGGFGALLLAERHPGLLSSVAAISPAIWTSYSQAAAVNASAFASAADFARDDVVTHAAALARIPVRIASGSDDPFHPGVLALVRRLGPHATIDLGPGCHDTAFFASQQQPSLAFLGRHFA